MPASMPGLFEMSCMIRENNHILTFYRELLMIPLIAAPVYCSQTEGSNTKLKNSRSQLK